MMSCRVKGPGCLQTVPAAVLMKLLPGFGSINENSLKKGSGLRYVKPNRLDSQGKEVGGSFLFQDVKNALSCGDVVLNRDIAPSLKYVDNGKGGQHGVVEAADLIKPFLAYPQIMAVVSGKAVANEQQHDVRPVAGAGGSGDHGQPMKKVSAMLLRAVAGMEKLDAGLLIGKYLRQMCEGQVDENGNNVSGRFIAVDVIATVLFGGNLVAARQWLNTILSKQHVFASLAYVASGNSSVSLI